MVPIPGRPSSRPFHSARSPALFDFNPEKAKEGEEEKEKEKAKDNDSREQSARPIIHVDSF
jgi:hypothetical protein